ncbi:MAG: DUF948 domain-containing protein [Deltaproteobacteria bacterium]|nr:DUF948 domain-containing protein [Deltaproteobacteria bacterium]
MAKSSFDEGRNYDKIILQKASLRGGNMNTIFLGLIVLAFTAGVIIFIVVMIELKGAIKELKELIRTTEGSLKPTLTELQGTLRSVRELTDNVNEVAEDVRTFSDSIKEVGEGVRTVSEGVKDVSAMVGDVSSLARIEVSSVKAGVRAGIFAFLKSLSGQTRGKLNE